MPRIFLPVNNNFTATTLLLHRISKLNHQYPRTDIIAINCFIISYSNSTLRFTHALTTPVVALTTPAFPRAQPNGG